MTEPTPHLNPTRPSTLVAATVLAGLVGWLLVSRFAGETLPRLTLLPSVTLILLAVGEAATARVTRQRIEHRPGTEPADPLVVARLAALAKASSLAGAILGGLYVGMLGWSFAQRDWLAAAADALPATAVGVVASALLVAAALWLENACRIPKGPDDEEPGPPGRPTL